MIVVFDSGVRLGNQLFQYAALKELYPNQRLLLFGFGALKQALESVDGIVIENEKLPCLLANSLKRLASVLAKVRIAGVIQESHEGSLYVVKMHKGLFKIYLLKNSFFQHMVILKRLNQNVRLSQDHSRTASDWLSDKRLKPSVQNLVFVHIRRGDYLFWPSRESPAVLDAKWYAMAIDYLRAKLEKPIFLLLSDDPYYTKDCFGDQADVVISENDQLVDLALMSLCQHGILSASSYSWWGAWFSRARSHELGIYIAPKYWLGHRKKKWMPEGFTTDWITYIK